MRKRILKFFLAAAAVLTIGVPSYAADDGPIDKMLKSRGNIIYFDGEEGENAAFYSEDIALLQDEVFTLPEHLFSPHTYSHTHQVEYINIDERTHTIHCAECGSSNDIIGEHEGVSYDKCDIEYGRATYAGHHYLCKCGYRWIRESAHNLVYEIKDDTYHTVRCGLADTQYCINLATASGIKEHDLAIEPVTGGRHSLVCYPCGYEKEEACDFTDRYEIDEEKTEVTCFCVCGNYITEPYTEYTDPEEPEEPGDSETDGDSESTETEEENGNPEDGETDEDSESAETDENNGNSDGIGTDGDFGEGEATISGNSL